MSFLFFIFGALMMTAGFFMVWKTAWWDNNWGDIGALFGIQGSSLTTWKLMGVLLLFVGFLTAFGIFGDFFYLIAGRFIPKGN